MTEKPRVTDVRIRKIAGSEKMKAVVSVTLNNQFVIHDIRIIEGHNGLFLAMPSKRTPSGDYRDIAHPISAALRSHMQQAVLDAYGAELEEPMHQPCADHRGS